MFESLLLEIQQFKKDAGMEPLEPQAVRRSDGQDYPSLSSAAKSVNGSAAGVQKAIQAERMYKGYHWL